MYLYIYNTYGDNIPIELCTPHSHAGLTVPGQSLMSFLANCLDLVKLPPSIRINTDPQESAEINGGSPK